MTLEQYEDRLDEAVEAGELSEKDAWYEMQEERARELYEREMEEYEMEQMMREEPYLFG